MSAAPKKVKNFRDLGGIPCADGLHRVSFGLLFRSGHAGHVKQKHIHELKERFGISTVADLRTAQEIIERPDVIADEILYMHLPPLTNEQNPAINRKNRTSVLVRVSAMPDGAHGYLCDTYRTLIDSELAVDAYRQLLLLLKEKRGGGVLWHCTQGKDRTGVSTAVVLMSLGVSRDEIMRDYLKKRIRDRLLNALIFVAIAVGKHSIRMAKSLNCLMTAKRDFMQAAFDRIDELYGDDETFLHAAIGLTDGDIALLRETYTEPCTAC